LHVPFSDADFLHPVANIEKMTSGLALDDEDRAPWLTRVGHELAKRDIVVACSALKRAYRDRLRELAPSFTLLYLRGERELLAGRTLSRAGHFMPAALLDSQLAILEPPHADEHPIVIDVSAPTEAQIDHAIELLDRHRISAQNLEQA
jgi:carbohydrate kinase (thermoresistant glucokinase family)